MSNVTDWCEDIKNLRELAESTEDEEFAELILEKVRETEAIMKSAFQKAKVKEQQRSAIAPLQNVIPLKN